MSEPWPIVKVGGRLENAETEWLHTNGAGAYSMSTVAMRHTRRYHGLLVAALHPPVDRYVIVSHVESVVETEERSYRLSVMQQPDVAPMPGYRFVDTFAQDPLPRWTLRLGNKRLERRLALVRGKNAAILEYTWHGSAPALLRLRPLMPMRRIHELSHEHGAMVQGVRLRPGQVLIRPVSSLPRIAFGHRGVFVGSPEWQRRLEYPEDKLRRTACEEDLWTPGSFEMKLTPGEPVHLVIAVAELPEGAPADLIEEARRELIENDPGIGRPTLVRQLTIAAEQFCADRGERAAIVAGYPWLSALTRDILIALPGVYLTRGKIEGARRVLATLLASMHRDFVPRRIGSGAAGTEPPSADATLWLFEAVRHFDAAVGHYDPFVRGPLYDALCRIFRRVLEPGKPLLMLSPDGLVASGDDDVALTWINTETGAIAATRRRGLTVELQALWSKGTDTLAELARAYGDTAMAQAAEAAGRNARAAFAKRFWCESTRYPYDCIRSVDDGDGPILDASIRPNALVALDVDPSLFERWQAVAILDRVRDRLLTVRGVRSLDPDEPGYRGEYEGTFEERRLAYEQGLAWTHLLGAYSRAALRIASDSFELQENLRTHIEKACAGGPVLGQVSQFADGEQPHRPGGCPAQATSVGELLRTLVWDLGL